jgi:hypothetical protein
MIPPPIIDRELFFGDPEIVGAQISPNGLFIAFIKPFKGTRNIWVKRTTEPFASAKPITADTTRPVDFYFWSRDGKYVLFVQDQAGAERPRGASALLFRLVSKMLGDPLFERFINAGLPATALRLEVGHYFRGEPQGSRNFCRAPLWPTLARATHLTLFPKGRHSLWVIWIIGTLGVDYPLGGRCDRLFNVRLSGK